MTYLGKNNIGRPYGLPKSVKEDLDKVIYRVSKAKKKKDAVIVVSGDEGTGKTTFSIQMADYITHQLGRKLTLNNVAFKPSDLIKLVNKENHPPGTVFVYDEAVTGMLGRMSNSKTAIELHQMFSTCRSKQYVIILCIPRFYELAYWMAVDRSIVMYKTFETDLDAYGDGVNKVVGYNKYSKASFWIYKKQKDHARANKVLTTQNSNFSGWPFRKGSEGIPFSEDEYETKKRERLGNEESKVTDMDMLSLYTMRMRALGLSTKDIAAVFDKSERQVLRYGGHPSKLAPSASVFKFNIPKIEQKKEETKENE